MQKFVLDQKLGSKLGQVDERVELCDEAGQTLGFFFPVALGEPLDYETAKSLFTDKELEQARKQPGGSSTAELLKRLSQQ